VNIETIGSVLGYAVVIAGVIVMIIGSIVVLLLLGLAMMHLLNLLAQRIIDLRGGSKVLYKWIEDQKAAGRKLL
jgi:hypothetical protein